MVVPALLRRSARRMVHGGSHRQHFPVRLERCRFARPARHMGRLDRLQPVPRGRRKGGDWEGGEVAKTRA